MAMAGRSVDGTPSARTSVGRVLESAFGEHDQDNSGMLDEAEFEVLMAKLDIHSRPGEFARIDSDGNGFIELSEFVEFFETKHADLDAPTRLLKATACLKNVDLGTRYIFPVVFAAYVIAMHLSWSGYGEDSAPTA